MNISTLGSVCFVKLTMFATNTNTHSRCDALPQISSLFVRLCLELNGNTKNEENNNTELPASAAEPTETSPLRMNYSGIATPVGSTHH